MNFEEILTLYMRLPEAIGIVVSSHMMDDFEDTITPSEENDRGNKMGLIAVFIGIVGIVVGATGIILANKSQNEVKALEARLAARPDKTEDIQKAVSDMDERLVKLGGEFVKLGRTDRQIQENTQAAFNGVTGDIRENREAINELGTKLTELVEKLENWTPTKRVAASTPSLDSSSTETESSSSAALEDGIYVIKSGDTLSKVAKEFGVSLNALLAANPMVNPRALQIGQKIVIP